MIGWKTNFGNFKKTEIIPTILYDQSGTKLEINKRKAVKSTNMWKLNNTFLNNQ